MIKWVYGNTLPMMVELKEVVFTKDGITTSEYIPPEGSEIEVWAIGEYKKKQFDFTIDGSVIYFTDDGTLGVGKYGIRITVLEKDSRRLRSFKCDGIQIVNCNENLELGEFFQDGAAVLDSIPFFWAKGEPFTYDDFTEEEIAELQRPATEAADTLTNEVRVLETEFAASEAHRIANEAERVRAEQEREATFATFESTINSKLDTLSQEQFINIFNN